MELRPILKYFVVTCTRARANRKSWSFGLRPRSWTYYSHVSEWQQNLSDNKTWQFGLNYGHKMTFLISPHEGDYSSNQRQIWCLKWWPFCVLPLSHHVVPRNYRRTRDAELVIRYLILLICESLNSMKSNYTTIKHVYIESANLIEHYDDVIMGVITPLITSLTIVYSTVYSDADQRKHQSSASLAFVWGIHRGPVNSPHKWPVTRKMFPYDDAIMKAGLLNLSSTGHRSSPKWCEWLSYWLSLRTGRQNCYNSKYNKHHIMDF